MAQEKIDPRDHVVEGQSFHSARLEGGGQFRADGTVGPPEPDPSVKRGSVTRHRRIPVQADADAKSTKRKPSTGGNPVPGFTPRNPTA